MRKPLFYIFWWITIPHLVLYLLSGEKDTIRYDVLKWSKCEPFHKLYKNSDRGFAFVINLMWMIFTTPEFRTVYNLRMGGGKKTFSTVPSRKNKSFY